MPCIKSKDDKQVFRLVLHFLSTALWVVSILLVRELELYCADFHVKLDNSQNGSDCLEVSSHRHIASNGGKICSGGKCGKSDEKYYSTGVRTEENQHKWIGGC